MQTCAMVATKDLLLGYVEGFLSPSEQAELKNHLSKCRDCSRLLHGLQAETVFLRKAAKQCLERALPVRPAKRHAFRWPLLAAAGVLTHRGQFGLGLYHQPAGSYSTISAVGHAGARSTFGGLRAALFCPGIGGLGLGGRGHGEPAGPETEAQRGPLPGGPHPLWSSGGVTCGDHSPCASRYLRPWPGQGRTLRLGRNSSFSLPARAGTQGSPHRTCIPSSARGG